MPYTAVSFVVAGRLADAWSDALLAGGALSVDVSDPAVGTAAEAAIYGEPGATSNAWPRARVVALVEAGEDAGAIVADAAAGLGQSPPRFEAWQVADDDWVRATQAQFGPVRIGDRLAIVPTWCDPPRADVTIRLDPGLAFGTGSHPTTRLCLEWLVDEVVPGASVLDYGCGSGILALAAAKLGAGRVVATDIDAQALGASRDNARANGVEATFVLPDALGPETFDIVVANILANPLIVLAPALAARVRPGGGLALSGILASQAAEVVAAYAGWFTLGASRDADGWVLIEGTRRND
jgi:ribosomal protein L11 methyltransferase